MKQYKGARVRRKSFMRVVGLNLLVWAGIVGLLVLTGAFEVEGTPENGVWDILEAAATFLLQVISPVYIHNVWLLPSFFYRRRYAAYALLAVLYNVAIGATAYAFVDDTESTLLYYTGQSAIWMLLGAGVYMIKEAVTKHFRLEKVQQLQQQTELQLLRSQMDSHFLFNSLNTLYYLTKFAPAEAPDAVLRLAGMMRYATEKAALEQVPLEEELQFLESYMYMQQLRREDVEVTFEKTGEVNGQLLQPMLLIPFVENSFKHSRSAGAEKGYIRFVLHADEEQLMFEAVNSKPERPARVEGTGNGLKNVRKRLALTYPQRHALEEKDGPEAYHVKLTLTL